MSAGITIPIAGRLQVISLENYYSVTGIELRIYCGRGQDMSESLNNLAASPPIQVKYAVILIAASVATGIAESMLHLANGATNGTFASGTYGGSSFLLTMMLFTFVGIFVTVFTYLRNKWAWMLSIAACLLVIPSTYSSLFGEGLGKEFPMAEHFFGSTSNTLYLLATLLLLTAPSRRWFLRR